MNDLVSRIVNAIQERLIHHLRHVPVELSLKAIEGYRDHEAAGQQSVNDLINDMRKAALRHKVEPIKHVLRTFLDSVASGEYDEALSCCTPGLRKVLRKNGVPASLDHLRAHLVDFTGFSSPSSEFTEDGYHFAGVITYKGDRSANFSLQAALLEGEWGVNAYRFEAIHGASVPDDSVESLKQESAWVKPVDGVNCPAGYPIKGSSKYIYHRPGGRFYATTHPIRCFANEAEAEVAGFTASRR